MLLVPAARLLSDLRMAPRNLGTAKPAMRDFTDALARVQVTGTPRVHECLAKHGGALATVIINSAEPSETARYGRSEWNGYVMWMHAVANALTYTNRPERAVYDGHYRLSVILPTSIPATRADYLSMSMCAQMSIAKEDCLLNPRDAVGALYQAMYDITADARREILANNPHMRGRSA